jgi:hypothetical protein
MKTPEQKAAEKQIISIQNREPSGPTEIRTTLPEPLITEEA